MLKIAIAYLVMVLMVDMALMMVVIDVDQIQSRCSGLDMFVLRNGNCPLQKTLQKTKKKDKKY